MTTAAPSIKSTAKRAPATATYKPTVKLTSHRGWYRVQSGTHADVWYDTSANQCSCPARKPCRHMRFVRSLNIAFYVRKETEETTPAAPRDAVAEAEWRLTAARCALADTDPQDDTYAVLLHKVDRLEREVAALNYNAMRAA